MKTPRPYKVRNGGVVGWKLIVSTDSAVLGKWMPALAPIPKRCGWRIAAFDDLLEPSE